MKRFYAVRVEVQTEVIVLRRHKFKGKLLQATHICRGHIYLFNNK